MYPTYPIIKPIYKSYISIGFLCPKHQGKIEKNRYGQKLLQQYFFWEYLFEKSAQLSESTITLEMDKKTTQSTCFPAKQIS